MISEYLVCPQCKTTLDKPVQYQVLGEVTKAAVLSLRWAIPIACPAEYADSGCRKRRSSRANLTPQPPGTEAKS